MSDEVQNIGMEYFKAHVPTGWIENALEAEKQTGCPASLTLAQAVIETGWGKNLTAPNNIFGIKWVSGCGYAGKECNTQEEVNGKLINVSAEFVIFPTLLDAFVYHGKLIMTKSPYSAAVQMYRANHDLCKFVQRVGQVYATRSNYGQLVWEIITQYELNTLKVYTTNLKEAMELALTNTDECAAQLPAS